MIALYRIGLVGCVAWLVTGQVLAAVLTEGDVQINGEQVIVGQQTDGLLTLTAPAQLTSSQLLVAQNQGVVGDVVIDAGGWTAENEVLIGERGIGSLTVRNGGQFSQEFGQFTVGQFGIGSLIVEGLGSTVDLGATSRATQLVVGGNEQGGFGPLGRGDVTIRDGGELRTGRASIATSGTAAVILDGPDSRWLNSGTISFGNADVTIRGGAALVDLVERRNSIVLGAEGGATNLLLTGAGTLLSTNGVQGITIGDTGQAVARVDDGADVVVRDTRIGGNPFRSTGENLPRRGVLELDGFGTTWTTNGLTLGGERGHAELSITNGATLNSFSSFGDTTIGAREGSTAIVVIDGPNSRWNVTDDQLLVGGQGDGELHIRNGAYHHSDQVFIGQGQQGPTGIVAVHGAGSTWDISQTFHLVNGQVTLAEGGTLRLAADRGGLIGERGTLTLDDGRLIGGQFGPRLDNEGTITGDGEIEPVVENRHVGIVRVGPEQHLVLGGLVNQASVEVDRGELAVNGEFENFATVELANATLRAGQPQSGGLSNLGGGELRLYNGENRVHGNVTNGGRLIVTGDSRATFFDPVENQVFFSVSAGSTALFLDDYTGAGIVGDGEVVFAGDVNLSLGQQLVQFESDVEFTAAADWTVDVAPLAHDGILSSGGVELGGQLQLAVDGPLALGRHRLTIVDAAARTGEFDFLPEIGAAVGERLYYQGIEYDDTTAIVTLAQLAVGDYNGDGFVNAVDYDAWRTAFGTAGPSLADGNGDGFVGAADYALWRDAMTAATGANVVPEPATFALLAVAALLPAGYEQRHGRK